MSLPYYFSPLNLGVLPYQAEPHRRLSITLIGCGGTGSFLAEQICRLTLGLNLQLTLVDPDTVEQHNLLRQNFVPEELGKNKAEALALRLSRHYGRAITIIPHPFQEVPHQETHAQIMISCVDNPAARQAIANRNWSQNRCTWLDLGNDNHYGQLLVGNTNDTPDLKDQEKTLRYLERHLEKQPVDQPTPIRFLPLPALQQPQLVSASYHQARPAIADHDCATAIMLQEQSPVINQVMATMAANTIYQLLLGRCTIMAEYIDLETHRLNPIPITSANIRHTYRSS